jgi:trimethylamine--corrinoid protein Co-methyltransferase
MGAVETWMISSAYVQVGKALGLPTHAYMGMSERKFGMNSLPPLPPGE